MRYPEIRSKILPPDAPILARDGSKVGEVKDFWQWAYSNLIDNTARGKLAEYLIACVLGVEKTPTQPWAAFDLRSKEGLAIEVKTSGYLQAWGQDDLSKIVFGIPQTHGWDGENGKFLKDFKRQSDVYVFCVHNHKEQETLNPLDTKQWDFYLLPTRILDEKVGKQRTISLSAIISLGARKCTFESLNEEIKLLKI